MSLGAFDRSGEARATPRVGERFVRLHRGEIAPTFQQRMSLSSEEEATPGHGNPAFGGEGKQEGF